MACASQSYQDRFVLSYHLSATLLVSPSFSFSFSFDITLFIWFLFVHGSDLFCFVIKDKFLAFCSRLKLSFGSSLCPQTLNFAECFPSSVVSRKSPQPGNAEKCA
ncbi:hypothetical protein ACJRO7_000804 [Eucalyptus globulus]|uniref:Uncharacterized protein n=1 Tax=Eucalyptus globulus TaxID=34317 RepID=A0ABD3LNZ0_EUCGL